MRLPFAAIMLFATMATSSASAGGHILDYGMYSGTSGGCYAFGPISECTLAGAAHVATARDIPGALGVTFGLHYSLDNGEKPTRVTVIFPPAGLHNPNFPAAIHSYNHVETCDGANCFASYSLDFPWEVVTGIWTFQVWSNGTLMLEQKFNVVLPNKTKVKPAPGFPTASLQIPDNIDFL